MGKLGVIAAIAFLVAVLSYFLIPLLWMIFAAFDPNAGPELKIPTNPSLVNFEKLAEPIGAAVPYTWILNSLIIASASATLATVLALLAAYVMTRHSFRGQEALTTMFVSFRLIPVIVIALPIMVLYKGWGLNNTLQGVILAHTALILPFAILILDGYLRGIPTTYEEAAMIDGCSKLGAFLRITLPLALPGLVTVWLISFVFSWGEYVIPRLIIATETLTPAAVGLDYFKGLHGQIDYGRIAAFSILYTLPVVAIFMYIKKYLQRGVAGLVSR